MSKYIESEVKQNIKFNQRRLLLKAAPFTVPLVLGALETSAAKAQSIPFINLEQAFAYRGVDWKEMVGYTWVYADYFPPTIIDSREDSWTKTNLIQPGESIVAQKFEQSDKGFKRITGAYSGPNAVKLAPRSEAYYLAAYTLIPQEGYPGELSGGVLITNFPYDTSESIRARIQTQGDKLIFQFGEANYLTNALLPQTLSRNSDGSVNIIAGLRVCDEGMSVSPVLGNGAVLEKAKLYRSIYRQIYPREEGVIASALAGPNTKIRVDKFVVLRTAGKPDLWEYTLPFSASGA